MPGAFHLRSLGRLNVVMLLHCAMWGFIYNLEHTHPQIAGIPAVLPINI